MDPCPCSTPKISQFYNIWLAKEWRTYLHPLCNGNHIAVHVFEFVEKQRHFPNFLLVTVAHSDTQNQMRNEGYKCVIITNEMTRISKQGFARLRWRLLVVFPTPILTITAENYSQIKLSWFFCELISQTTRFHIFLREQASRWNPIPLRCCGLKLSITPTYFTNSNSYF